MQAVGKWGKTSCRMNGRNSKTLKIAAAIGAIIIAGFFLARYRSSAGVALAFKDARAQGAAIADNIVNLSNQISVDLDKVSEYDKAGQTQEALDLTTNLHFKVQDIKGQASQLSDQLRNMIGALDSIRSPGAKQAAIESITNRMALISRLFSYGEYLDQLSIVLTHRFIGASDKSSVPVIVSQINAEVTAVGNFNKQAVQAMQRFDAITGN